VVPNWATLEEARAHAVAEARCLSRPVVLVWHLGRWWVDAYQRVLAQDYQQQGTNVIVVQPEQEA
jgi:hypothetical protein